MKYIKDLLENEKIENVIYLCKKKNLAITTSNKEYYNVELQDKTGVLSCKIWDPNSKEIEEFNEMDYVTVSGLASSYNGNIQLSIKTISVASSDTYNISDYMPTSSYDIEVMYKELLSLIDKVENPYFNQLLSGLFIDNESFIKRFKFSSAAASVHHAFVGGLLEHTLNVARTCDQMRATYINLNYDLLITAAILHDIGKVRELSAFPENKFTDDGNLLGHIMIGYDIINDKARKIDNFPKYLLDELKHCIIAHHGKMEYGSPKAPALAEALALTFADDLDAKLQIFRESTENLKDNEWTYNKYIGNSIRTTIS